jgi:hypothetical protein
MRRRRLVICGAAAVSSLALAGIGVAAAATLGVSSARVWAGTQALTKGTCTLGGKSVATDAWVDENKPTASHGGGKKLQVERRDGRDRWSFVVFDLSSCGLPTTGGADRATLTLTLTGAPKQSRTLTVAPVLGSWDGSLTWQTAQSLAYGPATTTLASGTADGASLSATVTLDVDATIKGPGSRFGWRIDDEGPSDDHSALTLGSSTSGSTAPTLTVDWER